MKQSLEDRFWSKVDKNGPLPPRRPELGPCWIWTAKITRDGYGCFVVCEGAKKRYLGAHRAAYMIDQGCLLTSDVDVDHRCFVKKCVRPSHLRDATRAQNKQHREGAQPNSKSGIRGVHWVKESSKWRAKVVHNRKTIVVGFFDDIEEAEAAVIAKRIELFTHNDLDRIASGDTQ